MHAVSCLHDDDLDHASVLQRPVSEHETSSTPAPHAIVDGAFPVSSVDPETG